VTHLAFYSVVTGFLSWGQNGGGREVNPSSLSSAELRMSASVPLLRPHASMAWTGKNVIYELIFGTHPF